jgi:membrane protein DedA with SNARE-associated domain
MHRRPLLLLPVLAVAAVLWFVLGPPDIEGLLTDVSDTLGAWTYALVGGLAFLETGAFVGLIAPGETAIVLGGVVAAAGDVSLPVVLLVAWLCAALGDLASFALGRKLGRRFLHRQSWLPTRHIDRVEQFYARHGAKAILVGRFIGLVRAVSPFLAGSSGVPLRGFLPWSLLGTLVWAGAFTLLGYVAGVSVTHVATYAVLALAVLAALALVWHSRRRAASHV